MANLLQKNHAGLAALFLILSFSISIVNVTTIAHADSPGFANDAFANAWKQLDGPVSDGTLHRPYLWGTPGRILNETFSTNQGHTRQVQYFPKGRMELTDPKSDPSSSNFVGDGQLVRELVTGQMQVGVNRFLQYDGAEIPISGDKTLASNPNAPTYRAFRGLFAARISAVGRPVRNVLVAPEGEGIQMGFASLNVDYALGTLTKFAVYATETGHNIPDVFWNYLNQTDANGEKVFNWTALFGQPLTDAYWTKVQAAGQPQDILVQLFERRTLLYNPALAAGQQVYSGEVGTDYYNWRYNQPELPVYDGSIVNSVNAETQPNFGESGVTFKCSAGGFQPNESTSAWEDAQGGNFPVNIAINSSGRFSITLRTRPLAITTQKIRVVVVGKSSGNTAICNFAITNVLRYTPAVEANQPTNVPASVGGSISSTLIRVGGSTTLSAVGFQPNEPLIGWISTPLNRVVTYQDLVLSPSVPGAYPLKLTADETGSFSGDIPAPGSPEPGIYAFTLKGSQSGTQAVFYFRVRAGSILYYDPTWGADTSGIGTASLKSGYNALDFIASPQPQE